MILVFLDRKSNTSPFNVEIVLNILGLRSFHSCSKFLVFQKTVVTVNSVASEHDVSAVEETIDGCRINDIHLEIN